MTTSNKKTALKAKAERVIYIGPALSRARLIKYQVFIGGLPTHLDAEFTKCPQLKQLFVPISQLSKAEAEVQKAGTPMNKYYKMAMEV